MPVTRPVLRTEQWDIIQRLGDLGVKTKPPALPPDPFLRALRAAYRERALCTPNDPLFIPGTEAWRFCIRTLREELLALGNWQRLNLGNYTLVSNDETINIVVATGDQMTAVVNATPRTKSIKGLYTEAAVTRNVYEMEDLFPELVPEKVAKKAVELKRPTWIFLMYVTDDEIRGELSKPAAMTESEISSWSERIIFPKIEPADDLELSTDKTPPIDIQISRKA